MKQLLSVLSIVLLLFISPGKAAAQDEVKTLFGEQGIKPSVFGSLTAAYAGFNGASLLNLSVNTGIVMNGKAAAGIVLRTNINAPLFTDLDGEYSEGIFRSVFGGLTAEPILYGDRILHLTIPVETGAGFAGYLTTRRYSTITPSGDTRMKRRVIDSDLFFFFEPGIKGELNLTGNIRLFIAVSYLVTGAPELISTPSTAFNGISVKGGITLGNR